MKCNFQPIQIKLINLLRGCSGSQKVGARKITRCHFHFQVPVLKVRSQFRSQLKFLQGAIFFEPKSGWLQVPLPVSCINGPDLFVQMYVCIVLLFFISISSSKKKNLYNLLQYTVFYGLSGIQPGFWDH